MYTNPSVSDFKEYFVRDFVYGTSPSTITDTDIGNAISEAAITINPALFDSQASYTTGFLYLAASNMVTNLQNSTQGVSGRYSWLQSSKGVGNVSESYSIPQRILDNPVFAMLAKNNYGAKYLMMILPSLTGQTYAVHGRTQP